MPQNWDWDNRVTHISLKPREKNSLRVNLVTRVSVLLPLTAIALAVPASAQVKETATCKLTNTQKGVSLYEGPCVVKQSRSGENTVFNVKMGNTEPFMFAGRRGSPDWMHGGDKTTFTDLPNGGIFKWGTFSLVVAEDR